MHMSVGALPTPPTRKVPPDWLVLLGCLAAAMAVVVWAMFRSFSGMERIWARSDTFAHGYLVAPISLWLMWRLRDRLWSIAPQPQPMWLIPMAAVVFLWLVADLAGINAATQLLAVSALLLCVPLVLGWSIAKVMLFPMAFLYFLVPVGEIMMPKLMEWTADVTVAAIRLIGIPVYRDGLQFVIPSGTWSVVEACSGVRYLIASFMVGSLFAYLNYNSWRRRLAFCLVSLVVPVVANWLRAIMIVLLGHYSGNQLAVGVDHLIYGWVFFGVVIMLMFALGAKWSEPELPVPVVGQPVPGASGEGTQGLRHSAWRFPLVVVAAVAVLCWGAQAGGAYLRPNVVRTINLAELHLEGVQTSSATTGYQPIFLQPSATFTQAYAVGRGAVHVHVAYYRNQSYGRKLVSSSNALTHSERSTWHRTESGQTSVTLSGRKTPMRTAEVVNGAPQATGQIGQRMQVRQVLWAGGSFTTSDAQAVLRSTLGLLTGHGDDAAAVTLFASAGDAAEARSMLDQFAQQHLEGVERWLASTAAAR